MKIEHLAIWVEDLEKMKAFYAKYFNLSHDEKYINAKKSFESYFLNFDSGCRLELMRMPGILQIQREHQTMGLTHFAISVGSKENVDSLTEELRKNGITIVGEPRTTGDGYYESVILDPEGNRVELTI